jgi:ferric-dicitrate binding protein FerR (iron transport regulator)
VAEPAAPAEPDQEAEAAAAYAEAAYRSGYTDHDEESRFAHQPLLAPRRNPARLWMMASALFATIAIGAVGATAWYGLPDWMPFARPMFAGTPEGLVLKFPANEQDRYELRDGTWYFGANGTVTNASQTARSVPGIVIVLRDKQGQVVHRAEVRAPKRVLAPGESVDIREALVPVPRSMARAEFGWKPN